MDFKAAVYPQWFYFRQVTNLVITQLNEFFCDGCCFILVGCGNVGLCAALNGHQPSLADWAAENACFLFPLSHSAMCGVARPVIELRELAIFVFLWWCEMWSEVHECVKTRVCVCWGGGEGGSQVEAEAAFKLEIHFHALVSLLFRVNNCPCFGSILQTEPQCYRVISPTCFFVLQHFN